MPADEYNNQKKAATMPHGARAIDAVTANFLHTKVLTWPRGDAVDAIDVPEGVVAKTGESAIA
jgi:hypothetical protein